MQGDQDYDDDDLFAIEQLLEQDKLSNSLSNQPIIQQNLLNNIIPNTPVTKKTVERAKKNHSEPLKEKPQKQAKLANFFEAPEAKKTVRNQAQSSKKVKTTQKKATTSDTATTGSARMNEYMQAAVEKKEKVDLGKMSINELIKHFSDHQTKITKNSGFDPKTPIDEEKAKTWMYLVSKSFREYQFIMVETCLFYNTLVCLPTGLGKTFVAANVIFNYYRWFPEGKIFFLAPTKPLVHQQRTTVDCIKGIDQDDILELTGSVAAKKRKKYYEEKRIFFMTPQTIDNDLTNGLIDRDKIVLVIFDEAHKALGKYSYSNVAKAIDQANSGYRIVALTATPGNNEDKIQEVLENLNIARLEAKDENDQEVKPYVQSRAVTEVVIKETLAISDVNKMFNDLMMKPIKVINNMNIFPADSKLTFTKPAEVNKLKLVKMLEEFNKNLDEFTMQIGMENRALFYEVVGIISSFCNIKKTLHEQGVQSFLEVLENFKANIKNKYGYQLEYKKRLLDSPDFKKMEEYVKGIKNTGEKHPKLKKLLEILGEFFRNKENIEKQSRVMIFTNNRSSANEICNFLQKDDMIRSSIFIGQGSGKAKSAKTANNEGINQKKQIEILKRFKDYELNTLIATCIGEEGLDIGEIDLIVCYDSGFSPIRLVQRMGRTGRKRAGKVIILLMEGREYMCYKSSVKRSEKLKDGIKANSVSKKASLLKSKANFRFYSFNPRMIPDEITPKLVFADEFQETKAVEALEEVKEEEETEAEAEDIFGDKDTDFTGLETLDEMQMFNQDSKGFGGSEELDDNDNEDDDDIDYDQICEMLDAQADKEKQEKSGNSENSGSFPGYMLPEDSMQIGLFVRNSNSTAMNLETSFKSFKSVQSEGNKKTLKRKYYDGEVYEPESGLKHVKLNKSADEQLENSFGKTHSSQET